MMKTIFAFFLITNCLFTHTSNSQELYFPPLTGNVWDTIHPQSLGWCQAKIDSLYNFLNINGTKSFMVLKDGKIVLEQYFNGHNINANWYWASAGKTLTAFMTGMAQQEGFLNVDNPTSTYLGQGWTTAPPEKEELITVWHQLTMTSGLQDTNVDLDCTIDTCLKYLADAGTRWSYHNAPYTLLDPVIENATGLTLNNFTNTRLKQPTGMGGLFIKIGFNNVYFSNTRSMARFGLLILNNGNWNGNQIMTDQAFFQNMVTTSQPLNNSYGYLWWLNGAQNYMVPGLQFVFPGLLFPNAPADMISALGKDGQILNVIPSQNLIVIRMGESPSTVPVPFLLNREIWTYLNDLICDDPVSINTPVQSQLQVYPNPAQNQLNILLDEYFEQITISDIQGKHVFASLSNGKELSINTSAFPQGIYYLHLQKRNGSTEHRKFIISR
jgi:CubicO group peptidase (beta-lactamase class C family)